MKKEITELINSENATLKINKYCELRRWTKNDLFKDVDHLEACFNLTHFMSHTYEIKARDWRGVVAELQEAQTDAFTKTMEEYNRRLENGHIG